MISRVAEGCFWLTRYLERVETLARLLDVHHALHIDAVLPVEERWRVLVDVAGQREDFVERLDAGALDDGEAVQRYLTWSEEHPASLYRALGAARENARTVREIMSLESWEAINDAWLWLRGSDARRLYDRDRSAFWERLTRSALLFHGVSFATMLHDEPLTFMKLGRAVERATQTARILATHLDHGDRRHHGGQSGRRDPGAVGARGPVDAARCVAALRSCCAYDPFLRSGEPVPGPRAVTRFLLFDETLPRSVLFNLDEARRLLATLRRRDPVGMPRRSRTALDRQRGELLQMSPADLKRRGTGKTLAWTLDATHHLCDAIHDDYLDPPMPWLRHCVRALQSAAPRGEGLRAA